MLVLRFFEGRSLGNIAHSLNISQPAAQKRVERALARLRQVLSRRGFAITVALLTKSLESWTVAAVGGGVNLSTPTIAAVTQKAVGGSSAIWLFRLVPHFWAGGLGVTLASAVALTPMLMTTPLATGNVGTTNPALVDANQQATSTLLTTLPKPSLTPTLQGNIEVGEIVRRVVDLAKQPQTELISQRGARLIFAVRKADSLLAVQKLTAQMQGEAYELRWLLDGMKHLCEVSAQIDFAATLACAEQAFTTEQSQELMWSVLQAMPGLTLDKLASRMGEILRPSQFEGTPPALKLLTVAARNHPVEEAIERLVAIAEQTLSALPMKALWAAIDHNHTQTPSAWQFAWDRLESYAGPVKRESERKQLLNAWKRRDFSAARSLVTHLPEPIRATYLQDVTFPYQGPRDIDEPEQPKEDWTPHADWLWETAPKAIGGIGWQWIQHDPSELVAWLELHPETVAAVMEDRYCLVAILGRFRPGNLSKTERIAQQEAGLRPVVHLWNRADPAGLQRHLDLLTRIEDKRLVEKLIQEEN